MATYKFTLSIGIAGAKQEETYEIDDSEFEGLIDEQRDDLVEEHWKEWAWNYIDGGWESV